MASCASLAPSSNWSANTGWNSTGGIVVKAVVEEEDTLLQEEEKAEAVRMAEDEVVQVQEEAEDVAQMMLADALLGRTS